MAGRKLAGIPWIPSTDRGLSKWTSPLTKSTLLIWDKLNQSGDYALRISPLTPLEGYPWFPPGEEVGFFGAWGRDGDTTCGKFAPHGTLTPPARFDIENGEDTYGGVEIPSIGVLFQGTES